MLNDEVADTAIGLLLNTIRELPRAENWLREGHWKPGTAYPLSRFSLERPACRSLWSRSHRAQEIAKRLEPFKVKISYHTRTRHTDIAYDYHPTLKGLAEAVDTLIAIVPKTPHTHKTIDAEILSALGPDGILINVGRGWTVDEAALVAALAARCARCCRPRCLLRRADGSGRAAGSLPNAVLLPHVASASMPTRNAMADLVADNLIAWFEKGAALTPVPETPSKR